jgi:hypothetical protein
MRRSTGSTSKTERSGDLCWHRRGARLGRGTPMPKLYGARQLICLCPLVFCSIHESVCRFRQICFFISLRSAPAVGCLLAHCKSHHAPDRQRNPRRRPAWAAAGTRRRSGRTRWWQPSRRRRIYTMVNTSGRASRASLLKQRPLEQVSVKPEHGSVSLGALPRLVRPIRWIGPAVSALAVDHRLPIGHASGAQF